MSPARQRGSEITCTDLFCGAGGSSLGAQSAGLSLRLAMNHWRVAIETHSTNFPAADHICADVSTTDPRRYPSTTILFASPECANNSAAKGTRRPSKQLELLPNGQPDPAAERSRTTTRDVPRFAEAHGYELIVVENVVEAGEWVMFNAWLLAVHALGYQHRLVFANAMHTLLVRLVIGSGSTVAGRQVPYRRRGVGCIMPGRPQAVARLAGEWTAVHLQPCRNGIMPPRLSSFGKS